MEWRVQRAEEGRTVTAVLRARLPDRSWNTLRQWVESGKIFVDGERVLDVARRVREGQTVKLLMAAPRPRPPERQVRILYEDAHVVVIDKPSGVSSVPYEEREQGTAMDLVRDAWRRMGRPATSTPLFIVHRIDKDTSGLLAYAKSKRAEKALAAQFRTHTVERTYLCVAHGRVWPMRIESELVVDRGDGLRGSARRGQRGKRAVTHVEVIEELRGATLCRVRLETGKTHQIRIHLAEKGHPLVGERVYIRDFLRAGGVPIAVSRLLLHAATLGFSHPLTGRWVQLASEPPEDFRAAVTALRR